MTRTSKRYAEEVTDRIDRVINSIRSNSPTLRRSYYSVTSSPVRHERVIYEPPVSAVTEINRIDNTCRALIAENDLLRDRVTIQSELIVENDYLHSDLNKVSIENSVLRAENQKLPLYENKVNALLKQSQDIAVELNKTSYEAAGWRNKFDEVDASAARYRNLYQNCLTDNESLKAEVLELRRELSAALHYKSDAARLQNEVDGLAELRVRLSHELVMKSEECTSLRVALKEIDVLKGQLLVNEQENRRLRESLNTSGDINIDLRRRLEECTLTIVELKNELAVIPGLEDRLKLTNNSLDSFAKTVTEREATIAKLNRTIIDLEVNISSQQKEINNLNTAVEQNARYRNEIDRLLTEADGLKLKLAKYIDIEHRLVISQQERENLSSLLSSKLETIREQNMRIAHLEEQLVALEQLKTKVALVIAENERLNNHVLDQSRTICEWADKYDQLERLYVAVKETTEHLEIVKNKFQTAVRESEIINPKLRNSVYNAVKSDLFQSRLSHNSDAKTAGSPSDLTRSTSPVKNY